MSQPSVKETLESKKGEILRLAAKHGAFNVRVFGSVARGEAGDDSDIDLLVSMEKGRDLFDFVELCQDIEEALGRHVDVLVDGGVSPYLKERIYSQAVTL